MGFIKEFRDFAIKGNVIDLDIGVVIGSSFGKIVNSLVEDIITPAVLIPALNAAKLSNLTELTIPGTAIKYGNWLSNIISFLVVAFVLFLVIKGINAYRKKGVFVTELTKQEKLLTEIRDALKK